MMRAYKQMINLPNILSLVRILAIPLLVILYYFPAQFAHAAAAIVFMLAALTDWLDGYLARYLRQSTQLGAFLDPVADKLIVCVALVLIVAEPAFQQIQLFERQFSIPAAFITLPAAVIVAREIIVSALREWMAEIGKRSRIAVSKLAKIKTTVQMLALILLLYCNVSTPASLIIIAYIVLYVAVFLTIASMLIYLKVAFSELISAN